MFCSNCGRETAEGALFCDGCGVGLTQRQSAKKTWLSTAAGVIDITDGGIKCVWFLMAAYSIIHRLTAHGDHENLPSKLIMAVASAGLGALAIAGGYHALRRKRWGLGIAGAIAAFLPFFPLGIASLILTIKAKDEFE